MAQGPDGKTIIIVKKVVGGHGHHGGSWKVAYADFVTSMMAFFMVLWLVNSASTPVRERIASYFRAPGVFEKGSGTPIEAGGAGILPDTFAPPAEKNSQVQPNNRIYEVISPDGEKREVFGDGGGKADANQGAKETSKEKEKFDQIAAEIQKEIEKSAGKIDGLIGKIEVKVDQRGLHLEIMDTAKASMFARGSADILPEAHQQLEKITQILLTLPNPLDIEGHTDAAPFKGVKTTYDNWSLSTDRANSARRVLVGAGMRESQVARVVGYASQRLKAPEDPLAATNRRISISMRFTEQASSALKDLSVKETRSRSIQQSVPEKTENAGAGPDKPAQQSEKSPVQPQTIGGRELRIETITTAPENVETTTTDNAGRPVWMEKDKIFGDKNPFSVSR